ncbi:MAG: KAP family NTPase [Candidatus Polarisedimenticolaceae bacterium]|nr:KAP family NTPase [Candidatus Polarisedimenticolaceae bacterium]
MSNKDTPPSKKDSPSSQESLPKKQTGIPDPPGTASHEYRTAYISANQKEAGDITSMHPTHYGSESKKQSHESAGGLNSSPAELSGQSQTTQQQSQSGQTVIFGQAIEEDQAFSVKAAKRIKVGKAFESNQTVSKKPDGSDGASGDPGRDTITSISEHVTHYSLNDSAVAKDSIGFEPYAGALAKLLCHKDTRTPLVAGVFGEWGAGKTTFMKLLQNNVSLQQEIREKDGKEAFVKQVWFNAWKYDVQNDLWAALLQAITSQIEGATPFWYKLFRRFKRLSNWQFYCSVAWLLILGLGSIWLFYEAATTLGSQINIGDTGTEQSQAQTATPIESKVSPAVQTTLETNGKELQKNDAQTGNTGQKKSALEKIETMPDFILALTASLLPAGILGIISYWLGILTPMFEMVRKLKIPLGLDVKELIQGSSLPDRIEGLRTFEKDLENRLDDYLHHDGRLIIYIDDLDRCSPEHAVEIIEAVNLFLETRRCIFVLGMDYKLISSSIEIKYSEISKEFSKQHELESHHGGDEEAVEPVIQRHQGYGEFFLEKIIQVPISVPGMTPEETEKFAHELMPKSENTTTNQSTSSDATVPNKDHAVNNKPKDVDISISEDVQKTFLTLLPYLDANPRTIKRFYNMLAFVHFFYISNQHELDEVNDISLTMWFFLQYSFPVEIKKLGSPEMTMEFDDLINNEDFPKIRAFFNMYSSGGESKWVMNALSGQTRSFYPITRFLAIY